MSKKLCRESDGLSQKIKGKQKNYYCGKCEKKSPKEKWCCKPKEIRQ
jgi:ribosomal protein S26